MSRKTISAVRAAGVFRKTDLFVYLAVAVLIAVLFCAFVFFRPESKLEKIQIIYMDLNRYEKILEMDVKTLRVTELHPDWKDRVEISELSDGISVKIEADGGYNVLKVTNTYAKMTEADCSRTKECVNNFPAISQGDQAIVCTVHHLKVIGIGESGDLIIGGLPKGGTDEAFQTFGCFGHPDGTGVDRLSH